VIQVAAATRAALEKGDIKARIRLLWNLEGDQIDISDRVLGVPNIARSIGSFLRGFRISPINLELDNSDRYFSPDHASSILHGRHPQDYMTSTMALQCGIQRADHSFEYVPVEYGFLAKIIYREGVAICEIRDMLSHVANVQLANQLELNPHYANTLVNEGKELLMSNTHLVSGDFGDSVSEADELLADIDWTVSGTVSRGTTIGAAMEALGSSALGYWYPAEDGTIEFGTEFPSYFGDYTALRGAWPEVINKTNAGDFQVTDSVDSGCTEVVVAYQGLSIVYRDSTLESAIGRISRTVQMPFVRFARSARTAARILYEMNGGIPRIVSFTLGSKGLLLQLGDRIRIEDPITETEATYRVTVKQWSPGAVRFEAALDGHETSIINGTFAQWDVSTWNTAGLKTL